jgi:hypothetical protein
MIKSNIREKRFSSKMCHQICTICKNCNQNIPVDEVPCGRRCSGIPDKTKEEHVPVETCVWCPYNKKLELSRRIEAKAKAKMLATTRAKIDTFWEALESAIISKDDKTEVKAEEKKLEDASDPLRAKKEVDDGNTHEKKQKTRERVYSD